MTVPTPPAVSDAMRDAVARDDAREKRIADIVDRYVTDCTLVHRTLTEEDVWLLEGLAFGPIASEIARLTGEADAWKEQASEEAWALAAAQDDLKHARYDRDGWMESALKAQSRAEAAEAETARLRAERDAAASALKQVHGLVCEGAMTGFNPTDGDWAERLFFSQADSIAAIRTAEPGYRSRAALSSQEQADV